MALTVLSPWAIAQKIRASTLNLMVTATQELQNLATTGQGSPIFATTTARDAAIPSPVAGAQCVVTGYGQMLYNSGAWVVVGGLPMMEVISSSAQAIANNVVTIVTMNSVTQQVGSGLTSTANGITITLGGDYLVTGYCNFAANGTGPRFASVNNSASLGSVGVQQIANPSPYGTGLLACSDMTFNAGDTISLVVAQVSTVSLNTANPCRLRVRKLR